jgi:hypothetical protein
MNNRWRSEIEAKNDPLAQGSEARAAFCSAKRLEDVKTTGKMKNIDAGIVPGTRQQSSPDPSPASEASPLPPNIISPSCVSKHELLTRACAKAGI